VQSRFGCRSPENRQLNQAAGRGQVEIGAVASEPAPVMPEKENLSPQVMENHSDIVEG
jgi:hypothetical protein